MGAVNRLALGLLATAGLVAGCGEQPPADPAAAAPSSAVGQGGRLTITSEGTAPARTAWYTRIENDAAQAVAEQAFPTGQISMRRDLVAGKYRVISWYRSCATSCVESGEADLGPLEQVCGAAAAVAPGSTVTATVVIAPDGSCSVHIAQ